MMTLIAQLCALCAVCTLGQLALPEGNEQDSIRMVGGLLMLHLVISGIQCVAERLLDAGNLMTIFQILVK